MSRKSISKICTLEDSIVSFIFRLVEVTSTAGFITIF